MSKKTKNKNKRHAIAYIAINIPAVCFTLFSTKQPGVAARIRHIARQMGVVSGTETSDVERQGRGTNRADTGQVQPSLHVVLNSTIGMAIFS